MRFNQFSYIQSSQKTMLKELTDLGFSLQPEISDRKNLIHFVRKVLFLTANTDIALSNLLADWETDLLTFFQSDREVTELVFYQVAFQLLGFVPGVDYTDVMEFVAESQFPIIYGNLIENLYQLLATRTKSGNTLIDQLVSDEFVPENQTYHFFNGKSLATFSTSKLIREVVYVETPVDTTNAGQTDIVKVSILRPNFAGKIPAIITNSPYHQGVNDQASDKALHKMENELAIKEPKRIKVEQRMMKTLPADERTLPISKATEKVGHISSYSLNDYFLARGFASIHVSGVGTLGSTGMMTSGDYQQVYSFKAVIDWLNGRARAYTDHTRSHIVRADWANGKVATTGLSYLGTMSNALATTGVEGLEVVIAEAGISSWYDYYRENGLVTSPGGYPGEDLDSLTALTYSRSLQAGDFLRVKDQYQTALKAERQALDRTSGDYHSYWHDRNYLLHADKVTCEVVFTHGSQDWNVKPIHVWNMFHALPEKVSKHLFFHNGAHVYMNNWQSIDFRESMNALLTQKLLGQNNSYQLPQIIWQNNSMEQSWTELKQFGSQKERTLPLGNDVRTIQNHYPEETFAKYSKAYPSFLKDLFEDKAQQITIDLPLSEELHLNGRVRLKLRAKSSVAKGLLSAQMLDLGSAKRIAPIPSLKARASLDNGRFYATENLMELPFVESPYRVITKGYLNLQNRTNLLLIESVPENEWMDFEWELQPTIYKLGKDSIIRIVLYTTDFECTIRDNGDWLIDIDLDNSTVSMPHE
ncbi:MULTISPECIES: Xaa-Pro dipeptidyl-peptidase [unclassified Streptococcus]|uniref:Xaa-Pro dipeptidyl-peptidase n=1 Tax=unclassified Streptococcus TaxID=2608887 RepID=UPI00107226E1|nr:MULTISPECIES: Xaa-Pro dipeptidyl-peptidase [unclassified Streptococcus]MBF0788153.1 Xaa-Pro dipeptidyl-peptidase [Streptococcus sp. 19428wC2_LYSM12]MCQ9211875.1 Xaa-Pro dipeptidyl-peptidase [Streptococcus sp. B01]MCQ9212996.1 Xaa-Pro dipeptidyl-peptidase [Streptococcus sp. O1]TFV04790.1 Xaa-Pro dipeptidyl-peptidase [Streptococcus sp. LYSM12]